MKKLSIALALVIGLSTAAFANDGEKKKDKEEKASPTAAFQADIMVYKTAKFALHFKNGAEEKIKVVVTDDAGKVIYRDYIKNTENLSKTYKMDEFPTGNYSISVTSGMETITKEISVK